MKTIKFSAVFLSAVLVYGLHAFACAPEFDNAYFIRDTEERFLAIPNGNFLFELQRISGKRQAYKLSENSVMRVSESDIEDLRNSMKLNKAKEKDAAEAIVSYQRARESISAFLVEHPVENQPQWYGGRFRSHERRENKDKAGGPSPVVSLSAAVPEEFALYLKGAAKYHANDFKGAIAEWEKIFSLSQNNRHFKSTWASFMIGKAYLSLREQRKAVLYFETTRKLAEEGYADILNLSAESIGWQALAEYELNDYIASINNYLKQMDVNSLNLLCLKISVTTDGTIAPIVKDKVSRNVLLGWVVSRSYWSAVEWGENTIYGNFFDRFLNAIEGIKGTNALDYADRVAWLCYNRGNIEKAKRWVILSKLKSPLARFVDFKITLREGRIEDAITKLSGLIPSFAQSKDKDVFLNEDIERMLNSEMAVLQLSRKEYLKAFELLLRGKYWEDIAYVAEKVLTADELEGFLKQAQVYPELSRRLKWYQGYYVHLRERVKLHSENKAEGKEFYANSLKDDGPTLLEALNYLLARRYARQENWDKAISFMSRKETISRTMMKKNEKEEYQQVVFESVDYRMKLVELKRLIERGKNEKLPKNERSKAYFDAGMIMRQYGMELMGTELDPDGFVYRGAFAYYESMQSRFAILSEQAKVVCEHWNKEWIARNDILRKKIRKGRGFFYGSEEEEQRALESLPLPNKRFHYRYKAAGFMWESAQLLPDNDDLKAKALYQGGVFLKIIDPKGADKFYKALVKFCGKTELGKLAEKKKWFPELRE